MIEERMKKCSKTFNLINSFIYKEEENWLQPKVAVFKSMSCLLQETSERKDNTATTKN
jgi:hypothetical protein